MSCQERKESKKDEEYKEDAKKRRELKKRIKLFKYVGETSRSVYVYHGSMYTAGTSYKYQATCSSISLKNMKRKRTWRKSTSELKCYAIQGMLLNAR